MREWYSVGFTPDHATNKYKEFDSVTDLMIDGRTYRRHALEETLKKVKKELLALSPETSQPKDAMISVASVEEVLDRFIHEEQENIRASLEK